MFEKFNKFNSFKEINFKKILIIIFFSCFLKNLSSSEIFGLVVHSYDPREQKIKILLEVKEESQCTQFLGGKTLASMDILESLKFTFFSKTNGFCENFINRASFKYALTTRKPCKNEYGRGRIFYMDYDIFFLSVPYVDSKNFQIRGKSQQLKINETIWVDLNDLINLSNDIKKNWENGGRIKAENGKEYLVSLGCLTLLKDDLFKKRLIELRDTHDIKPVLDKKFIDPRFNFTVKTLSGEDLIKNCSGIINGFFDKKDFYNCVGVFYNSRNEVVIYKSEEPLWNLFYSKVIFKNIIESCYYLNILKALDEQINKRFSLNNTLLEKVTLIKEKNIIMLFFKVNGVLNLASGDNNFRLVKVQDLLNAKYFVRSSSGESLNMFYLIPYLLKIPNVWMEFRNLNHCSLQDEESIGDDLSRAVDWYLNLG